MLPLNGTLRCQYHTPALETYRGEILLAFAAGILFAVLTWNLRDVLHDKIGAAAASEMMERNRYKAELQPDGNWYPSYAMSSIQKVLLSAMSLAEDDAIRRATAIRLTE